MANIERNMTKNYKLFKIMIFASIFTSMLSAFAFAAVPSNTYIEALNFNNATGTGQLNVTGVNGSIFTKTGSPTAVAGLIGNASNFVSASTQYLSSSTTRTEWVSLNMTLMGWVKPSDTSAAGSNCFTGGYSIASIGNTSPPRRALGVCLAAGGVRMDRRTDGVAYDSIQAYVSFPTTQWTHVAYVFNNQTNVAYLYINGTLYNSTSLTIRGGGNAGETLNGVRIGNTESSPMNGNLDSVVFYNQVLTASELLSVYNSGVGLEPPYSGAATSTNFSITGQDFYTASSLFNISVSVNGTTYSTTNGTVNLPYLSNYTGLLNFTVNASDNGGYFNQSYINVNISSGSWVANLSQSAITFDATEKISNATISGANFTTTYLTNVTHYMRAQTYNVTAAKTGYFSAVQEYTATAGSVASATIANLSSARLNLTVRHAITGALVNTYSASLYLSTYTHNETQSTTNGTVLANLISGNWNVLINASGYAYNHTNVTLSSGTTNLTMYVFTTESILFNIYDEQTKLLINFTNVTIELIGEAASYNITTSNGTRYIDLITPSSYTVRYGATGYNFRFWYLTVTERSTQNISLYLLNQSVGTNVTVNVFQQDGNEQPNALVKMLRYDLVSNSYIVREQAITDTQGKTIFDVQFNAEYYKFIIEYPIGTVALTTTPAYITETTLNFVINSATSGSEFNYVLGAAGDLSFNYDTNNFRFEWSDSNNVVSQACVYVYLLATNLTGTLYNQSCVSATSGTIILNVVNTSGRQYYAQAYFTIDGSIYLVDSASADFRDDDVFDALGIVICIILTVSIAMLFLNNPQALVLTLPIGVTITNLLGITYFSFWIPAALWSASLIVWWFMRR